MTSQTSILSTDLTALVLAGGRGSRLGGRDKGLVTLAGRPLIEHLLDRLRPQVGHILISANRNLDRYAALGHPVLRDAEDGFPGPLAGIAAGLAACQGDWLLCLPVDAPLLDTRYAERLCNALNRSGGDAACASLDGRPEPVYCLLHRRHRASLHDYLAGGGRAVHGWLERIGAQPVDCSDCPQQFLNLNREQDLAELEAQLEAQG